jgi:hypothetical protein
MSCNITNEKLKCSQMLMKCWVIAQSLKFSKKKRKKKNFEKVWSSIINKGSYEMRFLRQHVNND